VTVPTIRGSITAEYKVTGPEKEFIIDIPGNMESDFIIPDGTAKPVSLNGKKITPQANSIKLKPGINIIKI
jgi:hypothetical protein